LSRFVSGLLRDVPPNDPLALLAAATARLCVGGLASLIPARLAVRTDLMTALRAE
jgi:ABC-type lipoprotein release transport system permease subunit